MTIALCDSEYPILTSMGSIGFFEWSVFALLFAGYGVYGGGSGRSGSTVGSIVLYCTVL